MLKQFFWLLVFDQGHELKHVSLNVKCYSVLCFCVVGLLTSSDRLRISICSILWFITMLAHLWNYWDSQQSLLCLICYLLFSTKSKILPCSTLNWNGDYIQNVFFLLNISINIWVLSILTWLQWKSVLHPIRYPSTHLPSPMEKLSWLWSSWNM